MNTNDIRNLIALEAEIRIGKNRFDLEYKCEETCAEGVTDVLKTVSETSNNEGLNVGSVSCNTMYANMTASPYWYEPDDYMIRGDVIFFDWDRTPEPKPLDHVGIVLAKDGIKITYANINGSNHNEWTIQTMYVNNVNIAYWLRYLEPAPNTTPITNETLLQTVYRLQELRLELDSTINQLFDIVCKNK